ncbi:DNA-methyltransferase [Labedaea rhizosphaerae]|uniref:Methyltransferase n=1 Tax=Labedaea rhizosphaerae TaxID=598644 RepID=A0A4V3CZ28_LABRH|nr:site-specific DNA-methyltransferase [Labedaea rhizosphaerae]TDP96388.1 DNA modification methylase [Labedaea rhizosphaerae]
MSAETPLPTRQILIGDVRERLADLPDASVDCVITSPPYWALRDYGHDDQIGAEATVEDWATEIASVCDQLARVLTATGSLFLNLADGYSRHPKEGAAKKSLLLGPPRVALRLTRSGWLLRNQIVWAKSNPTPSSVRDRFTNTHEFLYFFTRQRDYHFDLDAVREPAKTAAAGARRVPARTSLPREAVPSLGGGTSPRVDLNQGLARLKTAGLSSHPLGKNPGDVWTTATASLRAAHFATFPLELVRRPLLSTCPERVCTSCQRPWRRAPQERDGRMLALGPLRPACAHTDWRLGVVLDPFMGAGTVALAAETYGRDWVGVEINPTYAQLAKDRLAAWRAKQGSAAS